MTKSRRGFVFNVFFVLCLIIAMTKGVKFSSGTFSETSVLAKQGKQHLDSLTEKANVPQFGTCWKNAVTDLQLGCKHLSENTQSDLALRFTDCFLQMSGQEALDCKQNPRACLPHLSDRVFNTYTEFYTYTQSICYFLQSQVWHEEQELTIDKLSSTSAQVSQQLAEAEEVQAALLIQQKQGIQLQKDLMANLVASMAQSEEKINLIMRDFESFTSDQKKALFDVFDELSSLKAWAVGEISWLDTLLFYTSSVILSYLFTSALRTQPARIYIFFLLSVNYVLERLVTSWSLNDTSTRSGIDSTSETVNQHIWVCRRVCVVVCVVLTLVIAYRYCDYNIMNNYLLKHIKVQNDKILKKLDALDITKKRTFESNRTNGENSKAAMIPLPYASLVSEKLTRYSPLPSTNGVNSVQDVRAASVIERSPSPSTLSAPSPALTRELVDTIQFLPNTDHDRSRSSTPLRRSSRNTRKPLYQS